MSAEEDAARIARALRSWTRSRRDAATRELAERGAELLPALLPQLRADQDRYAAITGALGFAAGVFWLTQQVLNLVLRHSHWHSAAGRPTGTLVVGVVVVTCLFWLASGMFRRRNRVYVDAAIACADRRSASLLIHALSADNQRLRRIARPALEKLLPTLQECDAPYVDDAALKALRKELNRATDFGASHDPGFAIAILQALEHIGDESALPAVRALASIESKLPGRAKVSAAARRCLPVLEARVQRERPGRRLLRAAENPEAALLLPAGASSDEATEARHLLRAAGEAEP